MRRLALITAGLLVAHEAFAMYVASHPLTTLAGAGGGDAVVGLAAVVGLVCARLGLIVAFPGVVVTKAVEALARRRARARGAAREGRGGAATPR